MGLEDLALLTPRARTILVGVLGAHDAGKTTVLVGNYLRLLRGGRLADAAFAGSLTLAAWESLAAWTRLDDAGRRPTFPPHTPSGASRVPGLLHVALRGADDAFRDVLLADAPGEWFRRWSIRADAPEAEGARWLVRHADAFLVLADCDRLATPGSTRGLARSDVRLLLERLGNHLEGRPTVFAWSKADRAVGDEIRRAIRGALSKHAPRAVEVEMTTERPETLATAIDTALRAAWHPSFARQVIEPELESTPFAAYRGRHVTA